MIIENDIILEKYNIPRNKTTTNKKDTFKKKFIKKIFSIKNSL